MADRRVLPAAPAVAMPTPKVLHTRLGPVHLVDSGRGPPVLAIHGGMGGFDQSWLLARALFSDSAARRVIAVSRPGYFGTPLASGRTPEAQADLLAALLDALGIERALVATVSAGGPSALHLALRHPDRCAGLILMSAASGSFPVPRRVIRLLQVMRVLSTVPLLLELMARGRSGDPDASARRSIPDDALRQATLAHPEAGPLFQALQASVGRDLPRRLAGTLLDTEGFADLPAIPFESIPARCLVLHGTADSVVPFGLAETAAARMPAGHLVALERGDHVALFTHLDEVRRAVAAFTPG